MLHQEVCKESREAEGGSSICRQLNQNVAHTRPKSNIMVEEFKRGGRLRKKDPVEDAGEMLTLKLPHLESHRALQLCAFPFHALMLLGSCSGALEFPLNYNVCSSEGLRYTMQLVMQSETSA